MVHEICIFKQIEQSRRELALFFLLYHTQFFVAFPQHGLGNYPVKAYEIVRLLTRKDQ